MKDRIIRFLIVFGTPALCISFWMGLLALAGIQLPFLAWLGISLILLGITGGVMSFRHKGYGAPPCEWEDEESNDSIRVYKPLH